MRRRLQPAAGRQPESGIALMVVMVVFIVLYLVVFHLHFYTAMEEKVARVRAGDIQAQDALHSVALYVVTLLLEDLKQDLGEAQGGGIPGAGGMGAGLEELSRVAAGEEPGGPAAGRTGNDEASGSSGQFVPIQTGTVGGPGAVGTVDHLGEVWPHPSVQTIGDCKVKFQIHDAQARIDLNLLFDYALALDEALAGGGVPGGGEGGEAEDLVDAVTGASDMETAEERLARRFEERQSRLLKRKGAGGGRGDADQEATEGLSGLPDAGGLAALEEDDVEKLTEFIEPDEEQILATTEMIERAVLMAFSINEDHGFFYESRYSADQIAADLVAYVLERRSSPVQNIIYHNSELLNLPSITPEVFYGPQPEIPPGEELETEEGFALRRDEFGDLTAEYLYYDESLLWEREQRMEELELLQEELRQYAGFADLSRLNANMYTGAMADPVIEEDDYGEYILEPTMPIGLKDIFTTFSNGRININTAPIPVLYALLPSLSDGPDGEAKFVAFAIYDYRTRFQEEVYEEGIDRVEDGSETPDLGQPRRRRRSEEEEEKLRDPTSLDSAGLGAAGLGELGSLGLAPEDFEGLAGSQDLETNYFTDLKQLELIDGTDGGPDDLLRRSEGVDRVSAEDDTLFQRVLNDYSKVMVFNSAYFLVELKAKTKDNPLVKSGLLILKRNYGARLMEVILWKELQK